MSFKLDSVVNYNTIKLTNRWRWKDSYGNCVKIEGIDINVGDEALNELLYQVAKQRLSWLLKDKSFEIRVSKPNPNINGETLKASVYLDDVNIGKSFFPDMEGFTKRYYKQKKRKELFSKIKLSIHRFFHPNSIVE